MLRELALSLFTVALFVGGVTVLAFLAVDAVSNADAAGAAARLLGALRS
jgi:hypothetical protein